MSHPLFYIPDQRPAVQQGGGPSPGSGSSQVWPHNPAIIIAPLPLQFMAPGSSFFDALVLFCTGFPCMVNREENRNLPVIGRLIVHSFTIHFIVHCALKTLYKVHQGFRNCRFSVIQNFQPSLMKPLVLLTFQWGAFISQVECKIYRGYQMFFVVWIIS